MPATFDKSIWLARKGKHNGSSVESISIVIEWCEKKGIEVEFRKVKSSSYDPGEKKIVISGRACSESQLYWLLHECGHHLVDTCLSPRRHKARFSQGYSNTKRGAARRTRHRVEVLDEELEAWYRGTILAERLNIKVNEERFHSFKANAIVTYAKWLLREPGWS